MNIFNSNFALGLIMARDLPRQEQLLAGLVAGQMPADSPLGALLLQPLVSRLATEEQARTAAEAARTSAESSTAVLQQPIEVDLPASAETARVRVPGATGAKFTKVTGSDGTDVDPITGDIKLPKENGTETIAVSVGGTARQITFVRGIPATTGASGAPESDAQAARFARIFLSELRNAASGNGAATGATADAPAPSPQVTPNADQTLSKPPASAARPAARRDESGAESMERAKTARPT